MCNMNNCIHSLWSLLGVTEGVWACSECSEVTYWSHSKLSLCHDAKLSRSISLGSFPFPPTFLMLHSTIHLLLVCPQIAACLFLARLTNSICEFVSFTTLSLHSLSEQIVPIFLSSTRSVAVTSITLSRTVIYKLFWVRYLLFITHKLPDKDINHLNVLAFVYWECLPCPSIFYSNLTCALFTGTP